MYVIVRTDDGKFVTPPGSNRSYTALLQQARTFESREAAARECCSNEHPEQVEHLLRSPK